MIRPRLLVRPVAVASALEVVARLHRHLRPPLSALAAWEVVRLDTRWPVGVALVGRPCSRVLQAGGWLEVTRVATDGTPGACSALYGAAARWARQQGRPLLTYTLATEPGTSLRGAGWLDLGETQGGQWDVPSRRRRQRAGLAAAPKRRWAPPWAVALVLRRGVEKLVAGRVAA